MNRYPRPHFSWVKNLVSKWVNRFDINKALAWEYIRGKRDGIREATYACTAHQAPVKMRHVSPGVYVCDQCQLDAHIQASYERSPNTGPVMHAFKQTGVWRRQYFEEMRPDLKLNISQELKAVKLKKRISS